MIEKIYKKIKMKISYYQYPKNSRRVVQTEINGYQLLVFANEDVGREIINLRAYEQHDTSHLISQIRVDDICADIGANIGYYTLLMAKCAYRGAVHAFEPVPLNRHLLEASVLLNGATNVVANQLALGDKEGVIAFSHASDGAFSSILAGERRPELQEIITQVRRVDDYLACAEVRGFDVIKVDVEGAEKLVVLGASGLLGNPQVRPRLIMMELNDVNFKPYNTSTGELVDMLSDYQYRAYCFDHKGVRRPFVPELYNKVNNVFFEFQREIKEEAGRAV